MDLSKKIGHLGSEQANAHAFMEFLMEDIYILNHPDEFPNLSVCIPDTPLCLCMEWAPKTPFDFMDLDKDRYDARQCYCRIYAWDGDFDTANDRRW